MNLVCIYFICTITNIIVWATNGTKYQIIVCPTNVLEKPSSICFPVQTLYKINVAVTSSLWSGIFNSIQGLLPIYMNFLWCTNAQLIVHWSLMQVALVNFNQWINELVWWIYNNNNHHHHHNNHNNNLY